MNRQKIIKIVDGFGTGKKFLLGTIIISVTTFVYVAFAVPPDSPYNLGETLSPACAPGDTNCTVDTPQEENVYLTDIAGITSDQGDIIYFNGTDWMDLAPGTSGQYLKTNGAGANPGWADSTAETSIFTTVILAEVESGSDNDLCYVVETDSYYRYEASGSSYTDDNTFVLSTGDGGNTRWLGVSGQYIVGSVSVNKALNLSIEFITSDYGASETWLFNQLHADTDSDDLTITFPTPANMVYFPEGASRIIMNIGSGRLFLNPNGNTVEGANTQWVIANGGFMEFTKVGSDIKILSSQYAYVNQEPDDISNLEIWLDPELGVTESGGVISQWISQDSNSRTFTQAAGDNQPAINTNDLNGRVTVENTDNDYMSAGTGFNVFSNTAGRGLYGIGLVYTTNTGYDYIIGKSQLDQRAWRMGQRRSYIYDEKDGSPSSYATQGISTNEWQIMEWAWTPGEGIKIFINGIKQATGGTTVATIDTDCTTALQLFDLQEGGDFDGKIAELAIYSDVPTNSERQNLRNYLSTKFALQNIGENAIAEVDEPNKITVAKEGGDYTVLADALASITDASNSNRYVIVLGQGEWTEDVTIPDYVYITGRSSGSVINGQVTFDSANFSKIQNLKVKNSNEIPIIFNGPGKYYMLDSTVIGTWISNGDTYKALYDVQEGNVSLTNVSNISVQINHTAGNDQQTIYHITGSSNASLKSFSCTHAISTYDTDDDVSVVMSDNTNDSTLPEIKNGYISFEFAGTNHANDVVPFYSLASTHDYRISLNQIDIKVSGTTTGNFDYFGAFIYNTAVGETCVMSLENNDTHWTGAGIADDDINLAVAHQGAGVSTVNMIDDFFEMGTDIFPAVGGGAVASNGTVNYKINNSFGSSKMNGDFLPENDGTQNIGSASLEWDAYLDDVDVDTITVNDLFNAPSGSDAPGSPQGGTVYFDTDDNKLKVYNGSTWEDMN